MDRGNPMWGMKFWGWRRRRLPDPANGSDLDRAIINYGLFQMFFRDAELEQDFHCYFYNQIMKLDVWWSIITAWMALDFFIKVIPLEPTIWAHVPQIAGSFSATAIICYLCYFRPRTYVAIRTTFLLAYRLYHQAIVMQLSPRLTPPDGPTTSMHKLPSDTQHGFTSRVIAHCAFAGAASNGYQLLSSYQVVSAGVNILHHLRKGFYTCRTDLAAMPGIIGIHESLTEWVEGWMQRALPLHAAILAEMSPAPCHVYYTWALVTFGFIAPLVIATNLEECSRLMFLRERQRGLLAPWLGVRLAHAAAIIFLGGRVVWALLDVAAPLLQWGAPYYEGAAWAN